MDMDDEMIKKKVNLFYQAKTRVHIMLLNKRFYNGYVTQLDEESFVLDENLMGSIPVFYSEVYHIEPFDEFK